MFQLLFPSHYEWYNKAYFISLSLCHETQKDHKARNASQMKIALSNKRHFGWHAKTFKAGYFPENHVDTINNVWTESSKSFCPLYLMQGFQWLQINPVISCQVSCFSDHNRSRSFSIPRSCVSVSTRQASVNQDNTTIENCLKAILYKQRNFNFKASWTRHLVH